VIDISSESFDDQIIVVEETLAELLKEKKPVIMVFNKVDKLMEDDKQGFISGLRQKYPDSVFISAFKGINLGTLFDKIIEKISSGIDEIEVKISSDDPEAYKVINSLHREAEIVSTKYFSKHIRLKIRGNKTSLEKILSGLKPIKKAAKAQTNYRKELPVPPRIKRSKAVRVK
jgi:GTP-binding protein HflX